MTSSNPRLQPPWARSGYVDGRRGTFLPHNPAAGPRGSLDISRSLTHTTDNGVSIDIHHRCPVVLRSTLPPALPCGNPGRNPLVARPSHLLSLGSENTDQREGTNAAFAPTIRVSDTTEADCYPRQVEDLHHVQSAIITSCSIQHDQRSDACQARHCDTATFISVGRRRRKCARPQELAELDTDKPFHLQFFRRHSHFFVTLIIVSGPESARL
jgi:hypothetical protein